MHVIMLLLALQLWLEGKRMSNFACLTSPGSLGHACTGSGLTAASYRLSSTC